MDQIDSTLANVRRNLIGVSDETAALMVERWRKAAEHQDARADRYAASGLPEQARLARAVAALWRQDADALTRQLKGPDTTQSKESHGQ